MSLRSKEDNLKRVQLWKKHLKEWSKTELSQKAYCKKYNLKANRFTYWKNKFKKQNLPVEFVQVTLVQLADPVMCDSASILRLNIKSGFQIEIPDGFSQITLERLLQVVV